MSARINIFLSSPMPHDNVLWETIRDSITAIFEHGPLSAFFALVKMDTEGGESPEVIYLEQVAESQLVLAVFDNEIRQGQQDEIKKAIDCGISIIAVQLNRTLLEETQKFVTGVLYKYTTVKRVNRHSELIKYILTAVSGLVYRRFRQAKVERLSVEYTARSKEFSELGFETIAEFCEYCREQDNFDSAFAITELLDLSDDQNFLLQMAVSASFAAGISEQDEDRLSSFDVFNREAKLIRCLYAFSDELFNIDDELKYIRMMSCVPGEDIENIAKYMHNKEEVITAFFLIDLWKSLHIIKKLKVFGLSIFESFCDSICEEIESENLKIDASDFVPEIEKCLCCMPRDNGEWVVIYSSVGELYDLIIDNLASENLDIPWEQYDLIANAECSGCGSPLGLWDTVYSDFTDDDEDSEQRE